MTELAPNKLPLLSARAVSKSYHIGQHMLEVLRNVDMHVTAGEFVALCGASGSGKSTLLHLLGGLDVPDTGSIEVAGQVLTSLSDGDAAQFRNQHVGFVFQSYHLLDEMDALENVCLPARIARRADSQVIARGRDLLAQVGLAGRMEHRPSELSGGEQQRVAIARALINQPQLVLADEPTGNLDSHSGAEIIALLERLHTEHGVTLLVATHDEKVARNAARVLWLEDGRLVSK